MDDRNVRRLHCLAVLVVISSTVSGFALPQMLQKSQPTATPDFFRRSEPKVRSLSSSSEPACQALVQCWANTGMRTFSQNVFPFAFTELTESLASTCPHLENANCDASACPHAYLQALHQTITAIGNWACDRQPQFHESAECWTGPFQGLMSQCVDLSIEDPSARIDNIRQCLPKTIGGLTNCTPEDREFFNQFSTFVLDVLETTQFLDYLA